MSFSSFEFIFLFLPITIAVFFALPAKFSSVWIIAASLFFYATLNLQLLHVLIISMLVNYAVSIRISRTSLIFGLAFNFAVLAWFKLTGTLPLGISFYTFTQSAYLVDAYRGQSGASSFTEYCAHVTFFGCITSGPIARFAETRPSFTADYDAIAKGLTVFVIGLFKKVCVADMLAKTVNTLFAASGMLTFFEAWLAAVGYAMQLYFDFSGYSDMAIGIGLMFGMNLPQNFASPYKSLSIIDFWRRWHMSLGVWVRDYLYIPLGGSREGELKRTRNVMLAMLFTGLWHGLGWTFVVWGGLHGALLAVNHWWRKHGLKIPVIVSWMMTFGAVVMLWVVFRAESLSDAGKIFAAMVDVRNIALPQKLSIYLGFLEGFSVRFRNLLLTAREFAFGGMELFVLMLWTLFAPNTQQIISDFRPSGKWIAVIVVLAVMSFWNFSGISDFLYFQF